jgi:2-polyprenyl-3-methyl-5-hydroxy-6-metoxy-1,4-benzoquinol methylase
VPNVGEMRSIKTIKHDYSPLYSRLGDDNRAHWEQLGKGYSRAWGTPAKKLLSDAELSFVQDHVPQNGRVLDIGVGTGRILEGLLETPASEIYGVDVASSMVDLCRNKFQDEQRIKRLEVVDLSKERIPYKEKFDLITAVRVLKYNQNWKEIVESLLQALSPGGVLVFSMPNMQSFNRFSRYSIAYYKTTPSELRTLANRQSAELVDLAGFTRIPDTAYDIAANNTALNNLIVGGERLAGKMLGKISYARELFVAVRSSDK